MKKKRDTVQLFLEQVGENIRTLRREKGFTLEALGIDIGLDKANMSKIEEGKNITLLTLIKISVFLDVHPKKLFQNTPDIFMEDAETYIRSK